MALELSQLDSINLEWLKKEAEKKDIHFELMAASLLDRHIRALRFFEPRSSPLHADLDNNQRPVP